MACRHRSCFAINGMHSVELSGEHPVQYQTADTTRVREIMHDSAQWFWAGDAPDEDVLVPWYPYAADQAAVLEDAYRSGRGGAEIAHTGDDYVIDFSSMQQFHEQITSSISPRCSSSTNRLRHRFLLGAAVPRTDYVIDFSSMQQFRSTNRSHRREVRRRGPALKVSGAKQVSTQAIPTTT